MKDDHYKISPTAVMCAEARAKYMDMAYAREIFAEVSENANGRIKSVIPSWMRPIIFKIPSIRAKVSGLEGRYNSNNEAIERLGNGVPILEIASGLSPRGLHIGSSHSVYLETDLEEMIQQKRAITEAVRRREGSSASPNHLFQMLNSLDYKQLESAGKTIRQIDGENPIAVVNEGLFMYLDDAEQKQVRDNIQRFLAEYSPDGAWITTDFSNRNMMGSNFVMRLIRKRIEKKTGRKFNSFPSDEEVADFLRLGGLKLEFLPNEHIARNLTCIGKMNLRMEDVLDNSINYRAAFITLRN